MATKKSTQKTMRTAAELERLRELALLYYMGGDDQKTIAARIDVSPQTVSSWATKGAWAERRGADSISRPELVKKLLVTVDGLITRLSTTDDLASIEKISAQLNKFSATIANLDKQTGIVSTMEVFKAFELWLKRRMDSDDSVTPEFVQALNRYHDIYVGELLTTSI